MVASTHEGWRVGGSCGGFVLSLGICQLRAPARCSPALGLAAEAEAEAELCCKPHASRIRPFDSVRTGYELRRIFCSPTLSSRVPAVALPTSQTPREVAD